MAPHDPTVWFDSEHVAPRRRGLQPCKSAVQMAGSNQTSRHVLAKSATMWCNPAVGRARDAWMGLVRHTHMQSLSLPSKY